MHRTTPPPHLSDAAVQAARQARLPWRTYRFRAMGMGLAILPLGAVFHELDASPDAWLWAVASCLLWPHLAFHWAIRSRDPFRAELRNLVIDSAIAGACVPFMHFNLLPSAVLLSVAMADKLSTGVRGLWARSLPWMGGGLLLSAWFNSFAVDHATSTLVIVASLPILFVHTLMVAMSTHRMVRRVQSQNVELDRLSRTDGLTGLFNRRHWQERAEGVLAAHRAGGGPAQLMVVDLDLFKPINDGYGHNAGDDVLRAVADCIRGIVGEDGHAGRIGGDEFGLALRLDPGAAEALGEQLCVAVTGLQFPQYPGLTCSLSLGHAGPPPAGQGLREWMEAADQALYRTKRHKRTNVPIDAG
ncbi:sensor domain-containing diguanylate cyclase [Lysobacter olei]